MTALTFDEKAFSTRRSAWGLALGTQDETWQDDAICAQTDPEAFFPEKGGSTREAKKICLGCPVRLECLQFALDHHERFGIWGGLSERERRRLKRGQAPELPSKRIPPEHGTYACYQSGCRRTECCDAKAAYEREFRRRKNGNAA